MVSAAQETQEIVFLQGFQAIAESNAGKLYQCVVQGMDISSSRYGISPVEFAAVVSSVPFFVRSLLENGCTICSHQSVASAMHFATAFGRADILEIIITHGCDP